MLLSLRAPQEQALAQRLGPVWELELVLGQARLPLERALAHK